MWQQRKIQSESEQSLINNPNDNVNSLNKFLSYSEIIYLINSVTLAQTTSHSDTPKWLYTFQQTSWNWRREKQHKWCLHSALWRENNHRNHIVVSFQTEVQNITTSKALWTFSLFTLWTLCSQDALIRTSH